MVLVVAVVIVGAGAVGLAGLLAWRWRHPRLDATRTVLLPKQLRAAPPLRPLRPAIEHPPEVHLQLHGVSAEDIAAILARRDGR